MGLRKQLCVDCCCPPVVSLFYTTKSNRKGMFPSRFCFDACKANFLDSRGPRTKQSAWTFWFRKEINMGKVSGKTHTKEQLDNWANQHNPNNKAYQANADNHSNQKNPKHKTHQAIHNSNRRNKVSSWWPEWAPDYPEYDD